MSKLDSLLHDAIRAEDEALLADAARHTHRFSPQYRRELRRMFHPNSGVRRVSRRIWAAVLAAVLLVGSVTATAFWSELQSFFQVTFPRYMGLQSEAPVQPTQDFYDLPDDWESVWLPEKLPEGYVFQSTSTLGHTQKIMFSSADGNTLEFCQSRNGSFVFDDSEGVVVPNLFVSSFSAYAFEKEVDGQTTRLIEWNNGTVSFMLRGSLSFESLIEIGENLQYTEIGEK